MKPISIKQQHHNQMMEEFRIFLLTQKFQTGKLTFEKDLKDLQPSLTKPTIIFSAEAHVKMKYLVQATDLEVGWHGTVIREGNTFTITDILVYPQTVTGVTTTAKEPEYANWLMEQPDEIFNFIRFQGHSHVNMGVTPSGVDTAFYEKILAQLQDEDYFIFVIINKHGAINIWLYDYSQNTIFEKEDIILQTMLPSQTPLNQWYTQETQKITTWNTVHVNTPTTPEPNKDKKKLKGLTLQEQNELRNELYAEWCRKARY